MKTFLLILAAAIGFGIFMGTSLKSCTVHADIGHTDRVIDEEVGS